MEDREISLNILDAKYDRNVSIEQAKKYLYAKIDELCDDEYNTFSKIIDDMYNELPPVTPKTGRWIENKVRKTLCNCSKCGALSKVYSKYCPNCGTRIVGEK